MSVVWNLAPGVRATIPTNGNLLGTYMRGWWQASTIATHGRLLERVFLTRVDPDNPSKPGAVLLNIRSISRAVLDPDASTVPSTHSDFLEVMYVASGEGRVEAGGNTCDVKEGSMVLFPVGMSHTLINPGCEPLEVVVVANDRQKDVAAEKEFRHANYHDNAVPSTTGHWHHIIFPVSVGGGLGTIVVGIDAMQIAEPHGHGPGKLDEVWYQLKGRSLLLLGDELGRQRPGQAFNCPPNVPHASINDSREIMKWLYIFMRE